MHFGLKPSSYRTGVHPGMLALVLETSVGRLGLRSIRPRALKIPQPQKGHWPWSQAQRQENQLGVVKPKKQTLRVLKCFRLHCVIKVNTLAGLGDSWFLFSVETMILNPMLQGHTESI